MDNFGKKSQGNERSNSGSSSPSRKGKNSGKPKKSKQPQRGLGVAQLEKIRLQNQLGCGYLPSPQAPFYPNLSQEQMRMQEAYSSSQKPPPFIYNFHGRQNIMMGMAERENFGYGDSQHITIPSWIPGSGMFESHPFAQPSMSSQFMNQQVEDEQEQRKKKRNDSIGGSSSQKFEKSDNQEVDLELRL